MAEGTRAAVISKPDFLVPLGSDFRDIGGEASETSYFLPPPLPGHMPLAIYLDFS